MQRRLHRSILSRNCEKDADLLLFQELQKSERAAAAAASLNIPLQKAVPPQITCGAEDIFSALQCDQHDFEWLMIAPATTREHHEPLGNGFSLSGSPSEWSGNPKLGSSRSEPLSASEALALDPQDPGVTITTSTSSTSQKLPPSSSNPSAATSPSLTPARSITLNSQAVRPSTLTRSSSVSAGIRSPSQTGRSTIPSNHAVSSSSSSSTPIKKPAIPMHLKNPSSSSGKRCVSVLKEWTLLSNSTSSSHTGSPATRGTRQPAGHSAAVLVGTLQEPSSNLCIDRTFSSPQGSVALRTSNVAAAVKPAHSEPADAGTRTKRLLSTDLVSRGGLSSDSGNGHKSPTHNTGKTHDAEKVSVSKNAGSKMVGRPMPPRRSLITSHGFGRTLSNNALQMALRHMDIEESSKSNFQYPMSDAPMSSLYRAKSRTWCSSLSSTIARSSLATSSNSSSEHGMSFGMDPPGSSKCCDETSSGMSSIASSISDPDSLMAAPNDRKVSHWLTDPGYMKDSGAHRMQIFNKG